MTDEEVQILIQAKNLAGPAMAEASTLARNFREAIESLNRSTAEGATVAQAMKRALNELTRGALEAGLSFEDTKVMVNETRTAMSRYIEVVSGGMAPQEAYNLVLDQTIAEMSVATKTTDTTTAAQAANTAGVEFAIPAWLGWAAAIAAVLVVLYPFITVAGSALVIITAFGVAAAGMATILGATSLGFLGLGALVVALANHFGYVNGPFTKFANDLKKMGEDLGRKAAPAAREILGWLDKLLPTLDKLGSGVLKWFSGELPKSLQMIAFAFNDLVPDFRAFGEFLGSMFDHVAPQIGPMFEMLTRFGLGAIQGLVSNLVRLSDWFQKELPTMGPVVSQIFSGIGNAVQWAASHFGQFADWLSKKWPDIAGVAKSFIDGLASGFGAFNLNMKTALSFDANGFFHGLGVVLGAVWAILGDVVNLWKILIQQMVSALPAAISNIEDSLDAFGAYFWRWVQGLIDAYNHLPGIIRGPGVGTLPNLPAGATSLTGRGGPANPGAGRAGGVKSFDDGGTVPGAYGAPMGAIVHGGEEVLSNDAQSQMIDLLGQIVQVLLAQLAQGGNGLGYSALANLEYSRSRGIA